ncbi:hypothetical protein [Aerococcus kribbianus]|uniref:DUF1189 domain-containing protein n=1 Tax=Aerococcus kribbianus TaxID=2999064 RepID=A0A9X3FNW7_9LACT|nr:MULTISPECIES: hypothetical protein [unclassified Aerococcus]MCZ0718126.1 hypothetical protein [Aerococcus sp. YH-aer221]MCZ0726305.1 hypothetical protein [Aerococcus sp. YH-aer222]
MFLINYIRAIFSRQAIFHYHFHMTWLRSSLVFTLWTLLGVLVMAIHFQPINNSDAQEAILTIEDEIDASMLNFLSQQEISNGQFSENNPSKSLSNNQITLAFLPSADVLDPLLSDSKNVLLIMPEGYTYKNSKGQYTANFSDNLVDSLENPQTFATMLNQTYQDEFRKNQQLIYLLGRHAVFLIFGIGGLFVMASFFKRMQDYYHFDIYNFEATVGLFALAMGFPSLLATVAGLYWPNILMMLAIMHIGTILTLIAVYFETNFKEERN